METAYFEFFDEVSCMFPKEFNNAADDHLSCHDNRTLLILKKDKERKKKLMMHPP